MILAIETATPVCSVALGLDNGRVVEKRIEGRGVHSERTFTFIQELLERYNLSVDDLSVVLFSNGPGSYTGLRIGAAAIKGLLFRREIPLYTLCTLTSYAVPFLDRVPVVIHSVIDARREHLYYRKSEIRSVGQGGNSDPTDADIMKMEKTVQSGEPDETDTENKKPENIDQTGETIQSDIESKKPEKGVQPGETVHSDPEIKNQLKEGQTVEILQSSAEVAEIKKLEKEIQPGEIVAGTGWERISHSKREKIEWSGSERISATNLIHAWNNELLKPLFKKEDVEQFEPDYLTMSQLNNSSI